MENTYSALALNQEQLISHIYVIILFLNNEISTYLHTYPHKPPLHPHKQWPIPYSFAGLPETSQFNNPAALGSVPCVLFVTRNCWLEYFSLMPSFSPSCISHQENWAHSVLWVPMTDTQVNSVRDKPTFFDRYLPPPHGPLLRHLKKNILCFSELHFIFVPLPKIFQEKAI